MQTMAYYKIHFSDFWSAPWLIGVLVALGGGFLFAGLIVAVYRRDQSQFRPGWAVGLIERLFFMFGVAFNLPGIGVAMVAWTAAKMAAGWNLNKKDDDPTMRLRMAALMGNLVSMLFAMLGGLVCAGRICW